MRHLGEAISQTAKMKRISAAELAKKVGKSKPAVYEDLKRSALNTDLLEKYAEILGVSVLELMGYDAPENTPSTEETIVRLANEVVLLNEKLRSHLHKQDTGTE